MTIIKDRDLRVFGLIWSVIFCFIAYANRENFSIVSVSSIFVFFSMITIFISMFLPKSLIYLYEKWIIFGGFIGKINSNIILFILFYFIITPISLLFKVIRKDLLEKKIDFNVTSYWIDREEQPTSMVNQF